jgi:hypothetical protein
MAGAQKTINLRSLGVYGHLFGAPDERAVDAVEVALAAVLAAESQTRTLPVAIR